MRIYSYVCIYTYVYVRVCMCGYMYICICTYTYICVYIPIFIFVYMYMCVCVYIYSHTYTCIFVYMTLTHGMTFWAPEFHTSNLQNPEQKLGRNSHAITLSLSYTNMEWNLGWEDFTKPILLTNLQHPCAQSVHSMQARSRALPVCEHKFLEIQI